MSNQIFNFNSNPVRVELFDNQPYFCLLDVCGIFEIQNSRRVQGQMLDPEGVRQAYVLAKDEKQRKTAFINEPNLYRIIFRSEKPIAKQFQNWVFEEVLPQIRKTGQYQVQQQLALPEPKFIVEMTEDNRNTLLSNWYALHNALELLAELEQPLRALGSPFASKAYTHISEYRNNLGYTKAMLAPLFADVAFDRRQDPHEYLAMQAFQAFQVRGFKPRVAMKRLA